MRKITAIALSLVLLAGCGHSSSAAASTAAAASQTAEVTAVPSLSSETSAAAESEEDAALTAFLQTTPEHARLSARDLYPSGTVAMYADPSGYSETQAGYVKKTNETWANMLKKVQSALQSAEPAEESNINEDNLLYTFALDDADKTVVSVYSDGYVKTVNARGDRHFHAIKDYETLLKSCAEYTAVYNDMVKEMALEAETAGNAAAAASEDLPCYIDVKVLSVDGNTLHVSVEGEDMTLDLSRLDNRAGDLKPGDVIRVSTSTQSLDTFAVIENAERITDSAGK